MLRFSFIDANLYIAMAPPKLYSSANQKVSGNICWW